MPYPKFSEIARSFAPGWFAAVMGTGVLALTIILMFVFKSHGLPKDPKEWRRIEQQRSAAGSP